MRNELLWSSSLLLGLLPSLVFAQSKKETKTKPINVVFILADDLGYGDLSCYGQKKFQTPNIDRLASTGMRFTQCYAGTTVSAPSRSSLLTGLHTGHTPIRGNKEILPEGQMPLPVGTQTFFHLFQKAGYMTGAFGKWGLGFIGTSGDPKNMGIDEFYGYNCQLLAHHYYPDHLWNNDRRIELDGNKDGGVGQYSQDLIHEKALQFLDKTKGKPFFLFYPTTIPHAELIVPEDSIIRKFRGLYLEKPFRGDNNRAHKGAYCSQAYPHATFAAMVYRLDMYVGQIVAKLKKMGVYENTMIIFASDNGPHREGGADPVFFDGNGIYRGYKRDLYEGGIRVPMIVSWPGHVSAGKETDFMCSFWDLMPTFNQFLRNKKSVADTDGISILPLLEGKKNQKQHDYLYFEFQEEGGKQAVRQGDWKLIHLNVRNKNKETFELYDIASDPQEKHNVLMQYPDKVEKLKVLMKKAHVDDANWPL